VGESANTSTEISEGDLTQDLEFPLAHFSDIVAATETSPRHSLSAGKDFIKV
jgi:hypothetical protein